MIQFFTRCDGLPVGRRRPTSGRSGSSGSSGSQSRHPPRPSERYTRYSIIKRIIPGRASLRKSNSSAHAVQLELLLGNVINIITLLARDARATRCTLRACTSPKGFVQLATSSDAFNNNTHRSVYIYLDGPVYIYSVSVSIRDGALT